GGGLFAAWRDAGDPLRPRVVLTALGAAGDRRGEHVLDDRAVDLVKLSAVGAPNELAVAWSNVVDAPSGSGFQSYFPRVDPARGRNGGVVPFGDVSLRSLAGAFAVGARYGVWLTAPPGRTDVTPGAVLADIHCSDTPIVARDAGTPAGDGGGASDGGAED